jgi:hypothetical protein
LPVKDVATGLGQIERNRYLRAQRLFCLVQDDDVPGGIGLGDGEVVFASDLAGHNGVAVPFVIAHEPHPCQGVARRVSYASDNIGWRPGTPGTGIGWIRLWRACWMIAMGRSRGRRLRRSGCRLRRDGRR